MDDKILSNFPPFSPDIVELYFPVWEEELQDIPLKKESSAEVDLDHYYRFGKRVMIRNIVRYFRSLGCPVCKDFVGNVEVWIPEADNPSNGIVYDRFTLNPRYKNLTDGWQLDVNHNGKSTVSRCTLNNLPTQRMVNGCRKAFSYDEYNQLFSLDYHVVAGHEIVRRSELRLRHYQQYGGGLPVVNRSNHDLLGLPLSYRRDADKYTTKLRLICRFIRQYLLTPGFQDAVGIDFPSQRRLIQVPQDHIYLIHPEARVLRFGNGQTGLKPRKDYRQYGPYKMPPEAFTYFFISPDDEKSKVAGRRLFNIFQEGIDSPLSLREDPIIDRRHHFDSLSHFLSQQFHWQHDLDMTYSDPRNALTELKNRLQADRLRPDRHYMAIILSNIPADSRNPELHELYYHMKEMLLKYGVTSQVIYAPNINHPRFRFFIPNIAAAIAGKQGGMPWGLDSPVGRNDIIVGIGASKQHDFKPYLGTAVCFDKEGQFKEFDTCQADDAEALGTSLRKAVYKFVSYHDKPDRLIIHYYKKLNRKEGRRIESILMQSSLKCPVYVVNIVTATNNDLIAFDDTQSGYMPLSGTCIHIRDTQYLLYNNERYKDNDKADILFPIKLTITQANAKAGQQLPPDDVKDIITQVYQFCRLYWKSVKMQNVPITIAYPELAARYVPHFADQELPEFGKHSLWML